ncbi:MAG: hypothetical protein ACNA71_08620 [Kiritimatiellia bacterium]
MQAILPFIRSRPAEQKGKVQGLKGRGYMLVFFGGVTNGLHGRPAWVSSWQRSEVHEKIIHIFEMNIHFI